MNRSAPAAAAPTTNSKSTLCSVTAIGAPEACRPSATDPFTARATPVMMVAPRTG